MNRNCKNHQIEIVCGNKHMSDVSKALLHSIIFFRTHGKFNYKQQGRYSVGTIGYETVNCEFLDLSYVRCSSLTLINKVNDKIQEFVFKLSEYNNNKHNLANLQQQAKHLQHLRLQPQQKSPNQNKLGANAYKQLPSGIVHSPTIGELNLERQPAQTSANQTASLYTPESSSTEGINEADYSSDGSLNRRTAMRQRVGSLSDPKPSSFGDLQCQVSESLSAVETQDHIETNSSYSGTLTLEFYTRRTGRWPFNDSNVAWEIWNIRIVPKRNFSNKMNILPSSVKHQNSNTINVYELDSDNYRDEVKLEEVIRQKLFEIIQIINSDKSMLPQMPTQQNVHTVFDTTHSDTQPYLYNISYSISQNNSGNTIGLSQGTSSTAARRLFAPTNPLQQANKWQGQASRGGGVVVENSSNSSSLKKLLLETLAL